jgi:phage shock protein PspC (stress-responsive transcriptional regulator)
MERVVTINLNGNPYQLEEPAYDALRAYLDRARAALAANPDQAEVIRDLEQAIADKSATYLSPSKSVISASEMATMLEEMGPVEGDGEQQESGASTSFDGQRPLRRLYRIYDRHAWTGVSAGLAAYAGVDVAWVRAAWILTAIFTGGTTALIYLVLIFAVPVAATSEELAAAYGAPFNAQEVIDRAKREYTRFTDDNAPRWRAAFREHRREWRNRTKRGPFFHVRAGVQPGAWDHGTGPVTPPAQPVGYATRVFAGIFAFIFSVITAVLLIVFLLALFSLLGAGAILGMTPPADVPIWLAAVILCIVYAAISAPFSALRRTSYATVSGHPNSGGGGADGFITLIVIAAIAWLGWLFIPDARTAMEEAYSVIRDFTNTWIWN